MLAGEQRRRHHDRDLLTVHRGDEGGAQRDFCFSESDIAADEPVHRPAGGEIGEHGGDCGVLVLGLLVRKAGAEFVVETGGQREPRRLAQLPLGGDLDEFAGDFADAVLHPRLARLPGGAAEPVELGAGLLGAVARKQFDILDRQKQFVAAGIMDFETIVRRAGSLDRAQAGKAADAVIDVDDEIAGGKARHFGDEILRALRRPPRPDEPLAENVLFGDQRDVGGLEAGFQPEHGKRHLRARQREGFRPRRDRRQIVQAVLGQHMAHAFARAFAPQRDYRALTARLQRADMLDHGFEHIGARPCAFGREIAPGMGADGDLSPKGRGRRWRSERRQLCQR